MTTPQEAVTAVAREDAEAAGLLAALMDYNARFTLAAMPTWDMVEQARREGFREGYECGRAEAEDTIIARLLDLKPVN